jgi:lactate permease
MLLDWLLAALPVATILVLMVGFRWGAAKAGPAGWLMAVLVAAIYFGAGIEVLAAAQVKALLLTFDVLLIIWGAFLLYRVTDEAGAIEVIGETLPSLIKDKGMQALLIGWPFASFLQGVGGFGVPTAVTAPLLIGLGYAPLTAVVVPSIGQAWSVTFGSLGSSFNALMAASGLGWEQLAATSAILLGLIGYGCGIGAGHAAQGWRAVRRLAVVIIILGTVMGLTQYLLATNGMWNIAGFGAGLAGMVVGYFLAREGRPSRALLLAMSAYLALIVITVIVQLVPVVRDALGGPEIRLEFAELSTARGYTTPQGSGRVIPIFTHAGALLVYATIVAYLIHRSAGQYQPGAPRRILVGTISRVIPSSLGIAALVSMAVVMAHAGMTEALAKGLAGAFAGIYPALSPWIGGLGAFMTGSNTNSNVVFGQLQLRTAELLGYSVPLLLAAQTAGAAIISVLAPSKVVVGASTAGMGGKEGIILRRLIPYCGALLIALSLVVWLIAQR